MDKIGAKTLSGMLVGYSQQAGGTWSGDLLIADWDELERAETAGVIRVVRVAAQEVIAAEPFRYPLADGTCRQHRARRHRSSAQLWPDVPTGDVQETAKELSHEMQVAGGDPRLESGDTKDCPICDSGRFHIR